MSLQKWVFMAWNDRQQFYLGPDGGRYKGPDEPEPWVGTEEEARDEAERRRREFKRRHLIIVKGLSCQSLGRVAFRPPIQDSLFPNDEAW